MNETILDILKRLATTNTSTEKDEQIITYVLHKLGINTAQVTCGCVYLDPPCRPESIHATAKTLLTTVTG